MIKPYCNIKESAHLNRFESYLPYYKCEIKDIILYPQKFRIFKIINTNDDITVK